MNHIFWATGHILLKPLFTVNSIITGQLLSLQGHLGEGVLALRLRFAPTVLQLTPTTHFTQRIFVWAGIFLQD